MCNLFEQFTAAGFHFGQNYLAGNCLHLAGVDFIQPAFNFLIPGSFNFRFVLGVFFFDTLIYPIRKQKALIGRKRQHEFLKFLDRVRHGRIVARFQRIASPYLNPGK